MSGRGWRFEPKTFSGDEGTCYTTETTLPLYTPEEVRHLAREEMVERAGFWRRVSWFLWPATYWQDWDRAEREWQPAHLRFAAALAQVERNVDAIERRLLGLPPRKAADDGE